MSEKVEYIKRDIILDLINDMLAPFNMNPYSDTYYKTSTISVTELLKLKEKIVQLPSNWTCTFYSKEETEPKLKLEVWNDDDITWSLYGCDDD